MFFKKPEQQSAEIKCENVVRRVHANAVIPSYTAGSKKQKHYITPGLINKTLSIGAEKDNTASDGHLSHLLLPHPNLRTWLEFQAGGVITGS